MKVSIRIVKCTAWSATDASSR